MSIALEDLRRDIRMRLEKDQMMSTGWILVPLIELVAIIVFVIVLVVLIIDYVLSLGPGATFTTSDVFASSAFVGAIVTVSAILFITSILSGYMLYKLVHRRNTHFGRQTLLFQDLTHMMKELASKKDVNLSLSVHSLERILRETRVEENEKNAVLWAILALAPSTALLTRTSGLAFLPVLATFYIYYFLMKDMFKHERREDLFLEEVGRALATAGVPLTIPRRGSPTPDRSFALYIVLSIVTLGFFRVYWIYTLLNDPNNHFRQHFIVEDTIMAQVAPHIA